MRRRFAVTFDYRCPFARNAHDHVLTGLEAGADWEVTFVPFSLSQVHVHEGEPDVWDEPARDSGLLALQSGVVVRDHEPERFLAVHRGLFTARHDQGRRIDDPNVVADVLRAGGVDPDPVFDRIRTTEPLEQVRKEHEAAVAEHGVWGVPTFVVGTEATFVRLMRGPEGDGARARATVERILDLIDDVDLNEFKRTRIPR